MLKGPLIQLWLSLAFTQSPVDVWPVIYILKAPTTCVPRASVCPVTCVLRC